MDANVGKNKKENFEIKIDEIMKKTKEKRSNGSCLIINMGKKTAMLSTDNNQKLLAAGIEYMAQKGFALVALCKADRFIASFRKNN